MMLFTDLDFTTSIANIQRTEEKWKNGKSKFGGKKIKNSFSDMLSLRYLSDIQAKTV